MKRITVLVSIALLALALPAAAAASGPVPLATGERLPGPSRLTPAQTAPAGPLRGTAGADIHGTVTYGMSFWPVAATLTWYAPDAGGGYATGSTDTDDAGAYAFTGVPPAAGDGELWLTARPDEGAWERGRYGMTWAAGQDLTVDWLPGYVDCSGQRAEPWPDWKHGSVTLWTEPADGNGVGVASRSFTDTATDGASWRTTLDVEAGTGLGAAVYFWMNQGVEVAYDGTVEATKASPTGLFADQTQAPYLETSTMTRWSSGKPGARVFLNIEQFPLGWVEQFRGRSDYPAGGSWTDITRLTIGSSDLTRSITIPRNARPGYFYWIALDHVGGVLRLQVPYQVCTLKPSRSRVPAGGSVRVSGVVPVQGHWGSTPGIRKAVVVYACPLRNAGQPAYWDPRPRGWRPVATVRTDRLGRFVSPAIRLTKTSTLVVRYPGDRWYWRGFTSPVSVLVD